VSSSDAVAIIVSITIIFVFTGFMIRWMNQRNRLYRELMKSLKDSAEKAAREKPPEADEIEPPPQPPPIE
jgi:hypothetical protein